MIAEIVPSDAKFKEKSKEMASAILKAATKDKVGNLPEPTTLNDKINSIYARLNLLKNNRN